MTTSVVVTDTRRQVNEKCFVQTLRNSQAAVLSESPFFKNQSPDFGLFHEKIEEKVDKIQKLNIFQWNSVNVMHSRVLHFLKISAPKLSLLKNTGRFPLKVWGVGSKIRKSARESRCSGRFCSYFQGKSDNHLGWFSENFSAKTCSEATDEHFLCHEIWIYTKVWLNVFAHIFRASQTITWDDSLQILALKRALKQQTNTFSVMKFEFTQSRCD